MVAMSDPTHSGGETPFLEISRSDWADLAPSVPLPLTEPEIVHLRGLGDTLDLTEVSDVYVPLSRLLNLYAAGARATGEAATAFLRQPPQKTPFVIGVAGSIGMCAVKRHSFRMASATRFFSPAFLTTPTTWR